MGTRRYTTALVLALGVVVGIGFLSSGVVTRGFDAQCYEADVELKVTLTLSPEAGASSYYVADTVPPGLTPVRFSADYYPTFDATNGKVKYGPIEAPAAGSEIVLWYTVKPADDASGPVTFSGEACRDGASSTIAGPATLYGCSEFNLCDANKDLEISCSEISACRQAFETQSGFISKGCLRIAEELWRSGENYVPTPDICLTPAAWMYLVHANGTVTRAALDGVAVDTIVMGGPLAASRTIALDWDAEKMYVANTGTEEIAVANLDGTDPGFLDTPGVTLLDPHGIAVDSIKGELYVCNLAADNVMVAKLDGTEARRLDIQGVTLSGPAAIALDLARKDMYIVSKNANEIVVAKLDGTDARSLRLNGELSGPADITLDLDARRMYVCNLDVPYMTVADLDGTNVERFDLGVALQKAYGIALDLAARKLYVSDASLREVIVADLDGVGVPIRRLMSGSGEIYDLVLGPAWPGD